MILTDGTDTREETRGPGKYEAQSGMVVLLDRFWMDGDQGEDWVQHPVLSEGATRYGRRVLAWDERGFLTYTRYASEGLAAAALSEYAEEIDPGECEVLIECPRGYGAEDLGECVCGRTIWRSQMAGTIYHVSGE